MLRYTKDVHYEVEYLFDHQLDHQEQMCLKLDNSLRLTISACQVDE
jgi:hypothetical protein